MSVPRSETRRKPGRPKDGEDMRDVILDQAEIAFAEAGFAGAKLRDIAGAAGSTRLLYAIILAPRNAFR